MQTLHAAFQLLFFQFFNAIFCDLGLTRDLENLTASNKGDSESDLRDQSFDTDDSGAHYYPEVSSVSSLGCATGSFKHAPILGNRDLEQRGKKTKTKERNRAGCKSTASDLLSCCVKVQVAALEVKNVQKAISRNGTLPKGARIDAYLESLKQSGMSPTEDSTSQMNVEQTESTPWSLSPRTNIRTQPQLVVISEAVQMRNIARNNAGDVRSSLSWPE